METNKEALVAAILAGRMKKCPYCNGTGRKKYYPIGEEEKNENGLYEGQCVVCLGYCWIDIDRKSPRDPYA